MLVVPETPARHLSLRRDIGERAESVAREHAEKGCARLAEAGIDLLPGSQPRTPLRRWSTSWGASPRTPAW